MRSLQEAKEELLAAKCWNKNGKPSSSIVRILNNSTVFDIMVDVTPFLPNDVKHLQRMYHIYNLLDEIPKCEWCQIKDKPFSNKYMKTCGDKKCHHMLKSKNGTKTRTALDENGSSIAKRASALGIEKQRTTFDPVTGLSMLQTSANKSKETNNKINPATGLSPSMVGGRKSGERKRTTFHENGMNTAQNARYKQIETLKANIDEVTGISKFDMVGIHISEALTNNDNLKKAMIETGIKKATTFCDNGRSIASNASYKGAVLCRVTKENNGTMVPLSEFSDWELYSKAVSKFTNISFNENILVNSELRGNHATDDEAWHLDHKVSTLEGFQNKILPFIIGSIHNLEMLPWRENITKGCKCSISINELIDNFYA